MLIIPLNALKGSFAFRKIPMKVQTAHWMITFLARMMSLETKLKSTNM